jgi:23S rRNA (uracil1939-C5)-methyltransferase
MAYEQTLHYKRIQVEDCFKHIGGLDVAVPQVVGMADPWHYRNKTALPVGGEAGKPMIGFYAPRSHDIIDISSCPVAKPGLNGVCKAVRSWMVAYGIPPYREESHTGLIRHIMARSSRSGEVMAVIVVNGQDLPREKELLAALQKEVPALASLCMSVHTARSNVILGDSCCVLWGQERLEDTLCGLKFFLSPLSFFQINPEQTEVLYHTALEFASLSGTETVADVYCGAGTISLLLARKARRVIGLETVEAAVRDARENAEKNGICNVDFLAGQAEVLLPKLVEDGLRPEVVVLDPPRKGLEPPVIEAIAQAKPKRVVYVSCNPATQARDAALFCKRGYRITSCQPVDMFCWTHGVENVLRFDLVLG